MKRVLITAGTRPEAIKMAPVYHALRQRAGVEALLCLTGQHRELVDQTLSFFDLRADFALDLMAPGQDLGGLTSRVLGGMASVLADAKPDMLLVHGDTTTAMAAALAAFYARVPVGHVEAGLRTWDFDNPFPEELNRWIVDAASRLHFAPTESARDSLLRCGLPAAGIHVTGNTVIDALLLAIEKQKDAPFAALDLAPMHEIILLTVHRHENMGEPIRDIFHAVRRLVEQHPNLHVVYPSHPKPQVQEAIRQHLDGSPRIHVLPPQAYPEFVKLMRESTLILTDSGGIQEEAPSLGKPILVLRETTERGEAVEAGVAKLIGTDPQRIEQEVTRLLTNRNAYAAMAHAANPYGDGKAAERIADIVAEAVTG